MKHDNGIMTRVSLLKTEQESGKPGTRAPLFDYRDTGCHADGTHGHASIRGTLADLLDYSFDFETRPDMADLYTSLRGPMPDDALDEYEALDAIQEACDGVMFVLRDGDLMCILLEEDGEP